MNKTIICPTCHNEIEIDYLSNFCQVCGAPIKNEEEIRAKAKDIVSNFKQGYDFFVNNGTLPRFAYNSTIENCEKIIAKKQDIIKKHNEILQEEKRVKEAKELEDKRREVSQIQSTYSKGYYYYAQQNVIPYYNGCLSSVDCDRVIANRYKIIQKHNEIVAEEKSEHLYEELNRLSITDIDKRKMFIKYPERLKDKHWISWAKNEKVIYQDKKAKNSFSFLSFFITLIISFIIIRLVYYGGNYDDAFERGIVHGANDQSKFIMCVPLLGIIVSVPIYYLVKAIINSISDSSK